MRDIAITALILGALPFVLRRPQLGVLMYVWISVMNPHRLTWGFAYELPFAQILAVATLVGVLLTREAKWPPMNSLTLGGAYYFMRNVKGVLELNVDLLGVDETGPPFVGHQSREHYLLFGIDIAY